MAGIQTIPSNATLDTSEEKFLFMLVRLRRNPYTKGLVAEADAFRAKIDAARAEERALMEADAEAGAAVHFADRDLDTSVDFVGDNVDRKSLLGTRLFGDLRPSELKKPILNVQLQIMLAWPDVLAQCEKPVLQTHGPLLTQRVQAAVAASEEKKGTANKLADFRSVGTRVKLNADHNVVRKSLYGKLGEIQHANNLPAGWAESFFYQDSSEVLTVGELDRKIGAGEAELESLKKQREALKEQEEKLAVARVEATRREKLAKLEALGKVKADIEAKEKALRDELEDE